MVIKSQIITPVNQNKWPKSVKVVTVSHYHKWVRKKQLVWQDRNDICKTHEG
jgi:hypothetical protein